VTLLDDGNLAREDSMEAVMEAVEAACPSVGTCSWVMAVPVISADHISVETEQMLERVGDNHAYLHVATYEFGWFVTVPSERLEVDADDDEMPPDLLGLIDWARAQGYDWIRIDASGDTIDGLPTFE